MTSYVKLCVNDPSNQYIEGEGYPASMKGIPVGTLCSAHECVLGGLV